MHGIPKGLAELAELREQIFSYLNEVGLAIAQPSQSFRCSCVDIAAQYNVHNNRQQTGQIGLQDLWHLNWRARLVA